MKYLLIALLFAGCNSSTKTNGSQQQYLEHHRPQIHFSPRAHWMNDPNGLVFYKGIYHLFFQYYPDSTVWGPMHWGHATSNDLVHWEEQKIALYPDSLGYIFSGSAVIDQHNTSGFGKDGKTPMVAIFTYHNDPSAKKGRADYQTEALAYSLDEGKTWTKYEGNPVLRNPGIKDFRDPKLMWHEASKKWVMTLATKDRISFYSSPDLKNWVKESEFGAVVGAHGGVWECPDLVSFDDHGKQVWALIVNINPGGPNGGSATQYFVGDFNGKQFNAFDTVTRWLDYGPDEYAGVTWSNVGDRKLFLGWMSNWQYATLVPTSPWRSAMTLPRDIALEKIDDKYFLTSKPAKELSALIDKKTKLDNVDATGFDLTAKTGKLSGPAIIQLSADKIETCNLTLSNHLGEKLVIGYDQSSNQYFIDRSGSGNTEFEKGFGVKHFAPRISKNANLDMELVVDDASVELFADGGLTVMTAIFFPRENYSDVKLHSNAQFKMKTIEFNTLQSIWK